MSGTVIILYRNYIKRNEYWKLLTKNDSSDPLKKHFTIHKLETTTIRTSISQIKKKNLPTSFSYYSLSLVLP